MKDFLGTKGEWVIDNSRWPEIKSGGKSVCMVAHNQETSKEEIEANQKLISVAPNLLEALQELIFLHSCEQEGMSSGQPTREEWLKAYDKAMEAINKALD